MTYFVHRQHPGEKRDRVAETEKTRSGVGIPRRRGKKMTSVTSRIRDLKGDRR